MIRILFFALFPALLASQTLPLKDTIGLWPLKVHMVHDGDGFQTKDGPAVRFASIDAPEVTSPWNAFMQPGGKEARLYLDQLIDDKVVYVDTLAIKKHTDVYSRRIADVYIKEAGKLVLVSYKIASAGFGWYVSTKRSSKTAIPLHLGKAVAAAKRSKLGIWATPGAINPAIWRKMHKQ